MVKPTRRLRFHTWRGLGIILSSLVFGSGLEAAEPRHGAMACQKCHLVRDEITHKNAALLVRSQKRQCGACHQGAVEVGHPVGFAPERPLPEAFPLDLRGRMTCSTCHDLHSEAPARLRVAKAGRELCLSCHPASFFGAMADAGLSLFASAHLESGARRDLLIDPYSYRCADCHEGHVSVRTSTTTAPVGIHPIFGGLANHPIGSVYAVAAAVKRDYRPLATLPKEVLLPDGKMSCLSCHLGYSREHGKLVRRLGQLCRDCHDK